MMDEYQWKELPSVKRKTSLVTEKILQPANVFWFFPKFYTGESILKLIDQVECSCKDYGLTVSLLPIPVNDEKIQSPVSYLLEYLEIKTDQLNPSIEILLEHEKWPDVFMIFGLENLEGNVFDRWIRFFKKWSEYTHSAVHNNAKKVFFVPINSWNGQEMIPKEDLKIKHELFYNVLSQVDLKFLIEANYSKNRSNEFYWINSVLVDISLDDPFLLSSLIKNEAFDEKAISNGLVAYGKEMGWEEEIETIKKMCNLFKERDYHNLNLGNLHDLFDYWTKGLISYTADRGLEIHSAAIAILQDAEIIKRRIWRGQLSLFYHTLDHIRYRISRYLTRTYGEVWKDHAPLKHEHDLVMTDEGPISEFGHLKMCIKSLASEYQTTELKELLDYVNVFWKVRNKLAHYRPLSKQDFQKAIEYLERF